MNTQRLYYQDPYIKEFDAKIIDRGVKNNQDYVILDKTYFYPEGGGQPWDLGTINNINITKVLEEDGIIYHYIEKPVEDLEAHCILDWSRRFDHMQQHLGQHILSGCFDKLLDSMTVGFHLGQDVVTIDVALDSFDENMLSKVEEASNSIVFGNLRVKTYYVDNHTIKDIPMRKPPTVEENIRIVEVDQFDYSGCGGIHPHTSGEVGIIKIIRWEKNKGNIRIEFLCGNRALKDYRLKNSIIYQAAALISVPIVELKDGVMRLNDEINGLSKENKALKVELTQFKAQSFYDQAHQLKVGRIVKHVFVDADFNDIKMLSSQIINKDKTLVLFANKGQKGQLIFARSKDLDINMSNLLKEVLPLINGTGGGSPSSAQGGSPSSNNIESAVEAAYLILVNRYLK